MDLEKRLYEALRQATLNPRGSKPDLFKAPPEGSIRQTEQGPIWMIETSYEEGYLHGRTELALDISSAPLEILDPYCYNGNFNFSKTAVIDTETTGLAGGTGTYPFIIGVGFWTENRFVVRQYILRDFSEEPAQLRTLASDLAGLSGILTYNGKTFDMPLLRTRFRINRMEIPFGNHLHLDFMHPCRRLYKRHFDSLNLTNLEEKVLGFDREDDVPAHIIPRLYFDYLQNRDESILLPIVNHNRNDIVSLYMLAQETFRRVELALAQSLDDDLLLLSVGQILYRSGQCQRSRELLSCIKPQFAPRDIVDETLRLHSKAAHKMKDWDDALKIWNQMLRLGRFGCYPHIELAKHHEHRLKDYQRALDYTKIALRLVEFEREFVSPASYQNTLAALKKRQSRLLEKMNKQQNVSS
ncbi:MAG TPA: hypothetical protein DCZ43_04170 [candidate division Zixibacteria bacterium]|nr:hypothetical protein [candidate division Zixibacteria bacterium]